MVRFELDSESAKKALETIQKLRNRTVRYLGKNPGSSAQQISEYVGCEPAETANILLPPLIQSGMVKVKQKCSVNSVVDVYSLNAQQVKNIKTVLKGVMV